MKYDPEFLENYWMPLPPTGDFKSDPRIVVRSEGVYMYNDSEELILMARHILLRSRSQQAGNCPGGA